MERIPCWNCGEPTDEDTMVESCDHEGNVILVCDVCWTENDMAPDWLDPAGGDTYDSDIID